VWHHIGFHDAAEISLLFGVMVYFWDTFNDIYFFPITRQPLGGLGRLIFRGFTITLRHTTLGRTPLDEWPARSTDLYLTTHNIHNRQTSMPPVGFEPIIPVSERPQTHVLDRTATGIGLMTSMLILMNYICCLLIQEQTNIDELHLPASVSRLCS
jgi:hypothetical protein